MFQVRTSVIIVPTAEVRQHPRSTGSRRCTGSLA